MLHIVAAIVGVHRISEVHVMLLLVFVFRGVFVFALLD